MVAVELGGAEGGGRRRILGAAVRVWAWARRRLQPGGPGQRPASLVARASGGAFQDSTASWLGEEVRAGFGSSLGPIWASDLGRLGPDLGHGASAVLPLSGGDSSECSSP